ncbi:MAG: cysteine desulfurase [Candidatus Pacebacteria bacterium]|nr:cysteine desulfurase [Candidatus Paceibacterota bacterium]
MFIYLDNAATTQVDPRVLLAMEKYFLQDFANSSAIHIAGEKVDKDLNLAKEKVAKLLRADNKELIFTGSASEANNFIIKGVMRANKDKGKHLIVSQIEHPCVLAPAKELTQEGFEVSYVPVDKNGLVKLSELQKMIKPETVLVSIMTANNELGTVQDISKIAKIVKKAGAYFHTDAVQVVPYLDINMEKDNIDFLTLSAHKFHGPKGVGLAVISPEIKITPLITGGEQNNSLRAGTINTPGIIGFSKALEIAYRDKDKIREKVKGLRDYFLNKVKREIDKVELNGSLEKRLPSNLNLRFHGVEGEAVLMDLSQQGICVSTGSACSAQNLKTSYVLQALSITPDYLNSNIRFSFSKYNSKKELDETIKVLKASVARLRAFSPIK